MPKKDFTGGINSLLGEEKTDKPEVKAQPVKREEITKTTQEGTYEGETRATFIINENKLETLKALAYWERKKIKNLLDEALAMFIESKAPDIEKAKTEFDKSKK